MGIGYCLWRNQEVLKLGSVHPWTFSFFNIILAIWGFLQFCRNLRIGFSISIKMAIGVLIGIVLTL